MTEEEPTLLVTGASGFLGGWLVALGRQSWQVHAIWRRTPFRLPGTVWHQCDLTDDSAVESLIRDIKPQAIIHAAAEANLDWCEDHPDQARRANVDATGHLAQLAVDIGARFVFVSTDMVFDGERGNYTEADPVKPISVYGKTKAEAEALVQRVAPQAAVARTALIFGKPYLGGSSFSEWIEQKVHAGEPVPLFTDQYRTPILVQNLSEALLELAGNRLSGLFHLAGTERIDRYTFGQKLVRKLGLSAERLQPAKLADIRFRAPRPRDLSLNIARAKTALKTPFLDIDTALERLLSEQPDVDSTIQA